MTMAEAGTVHVEWTPRGWMSAELDLLAFEQQLYLRQPGYGTSYVTGKYLLEQLLGEYSKIADEQGRLFVMADFFDELNNAGSIPISLVRWQMTGTDLLSISAGPAYRVRRLRAKPRRRDRVVDEEGLGETKP